MRFQTQYDRFASVGESGSSISKTLPDQTMTIREIMERFAKGLSFSDGKVPIYEGDEDNEFPHDFHTWDYAEKEAYIDAKKEELDQIKFKYSKAPEEPKKAVKTEEKGTEKDEPSPKETPKEK